MRRAAAHLIGAACLLAAVVVMPGSASAQTYTSNDTVYGFGINDIGCGSGCQDYVNSPAWYTLYPAPYVSSIIPRASVCTTWRAQYTDSYSLYTGGNRWYYWSVTVVDASNTCDWRVGVYNGN